MPGLVGFTRRSIDGHETKLALGRMQSYIAHHDFYKNETLFCTPELCGTRSHLNIIQTEPQPVQESGIYVWLEGEFYNQDELIRMTPNHPKTDPELLLQLYKEYGDFSFLKNIDGYYAAVLYNKRENKVHLITDRYGLKPLYWGIINGDLVWSSEVKGFLGYPNFEPVIDHQAVAEFFDYGYLLENRTWFEGIELVPPASVLTFDLNKSELEAQHYWSWSSIKPIREPFDEKELVEELGRLFRDAVHRRVNNSERIGITLSGGLDSRAILAAIPEDYKQLHTFTFGQKGCDDIRIAKEVSRVKGAIHHILELNSNNWLMPRINGVWKSDASFSLLHMHGIEFYNDYKSHMDFNLNGIWGGTIGGLFLDMPQNCSEAWSIRNRSRRFTNQALILGETHFIHRRPFQDRKFSDFVFSIPDDLRRNYYIYKKMLLGTFPGYYNGIPWQKTGCPISYSKTLVRLTRFKNRVVNKLKRESQRFGFNFKDLRGYTNYPEWIRKEPARSFFEELLLNKKAIYPEYIDRNKIQGFMTNHIEEKANYHNELCLALTFELWLQQVFEEKYRSSVT